MTGLRVISYLYVALVYIGEYILLTIVKVGTWYLYLPSMTGGETENLVNLLVRVPQPGSSLVIEALTEYTG